MHRMMMFQLYSVPGNLLPNVEQDSKCILHVVLRIEHFHFDSTLIIIGIGVLRIIFNPE